MPPKIIFYKELCDNSPSCWFIQNCPQQVFEYHANEELLSRIVFSPDKCNGCRRCEGHCPVSRVVDKEEDGKRFISAISQLPKRDMTEERYGVEPIDGTMNIFSETVQETLNVMQDENTIYCITLFDKSLCGQVALPYKIIKEKLEELIRNIFPSCSLNPIKHYSIYTKENTEVYQEFLKKLGIEDNVESPVLFIYKNKEMLASNSVGKIQSSQGIKVEQLVNGISEKLQ